MVEIARSYLNPELEQNKNALMSSVTKLLEETNGIVEKETTNQKVSTVKNKNLPFYG